MFGFPVPTAASQPEGIPTGPDGALWFTEYAADKIGRVTVGGAFTEFTLPAGRHPIEIVTGSDGALWFTEQAGYVGRLTTGGTLLHYNLVGTQHEGIAAGPDGALWFTDIADNAILRLTVDGFLAFYGLPAPASTPRGIAAGPDGALWFTESDGNRIGRITTGGAITEFT